MRLHRENYYSVNGKQVDVDINIKVGVGLLTGPNGIGKSTFLNTLKTDVKLVFENKKVSFMDQFPLVPVNEARLSDILRMMGERFDHFNLKQAKHLIEKFKLEYLLDRSIKLLSGGENQLVKFILAVSQKVEFFFLDEPLQFLDKDKCILVKEHLLFLAKEHSVFIIEHQSDQLVGFDLHRYEMKESNGRINIYGY